MCGTDYSKDSLPMTLPTTDAERLERIARETARMSYPGSMSRGTKPVVKEGTKQTVEVYFAGKFPLRELRLPNAVTLESFDRWHEARTDEIAQSISGLVCGPNKPHAVAAKFLNTFLHQLMKYEEFRRFLPALHLPLDAKVFRVLRSLDSPSTAGVQDFLGGSPYRLTYSDHSNIQRALLGLVDELNLRPGAEFQVRSRIELNWLLWVDDAA
jgi:hypothetical protein